MKITVKTTQGKVFQIEVEGSDTISVLKTKIHESQGHAKEVQKIIYSGKILTDDKTIESCGIKEKDFLVLMVSKPKPTSSPVATSSSAPTHAIPVVVAPAPTAPEVAPLAPVVVVPATPAAQSAPDATTPEVASGPAAAFVDPSSFLSGEALQATINNMVEMGFPRDQVMRALRASYNNPDRAVEYLMNGIPAHLEAEMAAGPPPAAPATQPAQPAPAAAAAAATSTPVTASAPSQPAQPQNLFQLAQQQQQQARSGAGATAGASAAAGGRAPAIDVEALRNNPMIQQLREQIAQNPALIQPIIQQLAGQNPAIAQMIAQDPEMLLPLLGVGMEVDEDGENLPPNAHVVSVTPEERAAIERLEALGFPRQAVLEAYFACDKNEELAANYLFEGGFDN